MHLKHENIYVILFIRISSNGSLDAVMKRTSDHLNIKKGDDTIEENDRENENVN